MNSYTGRKEKENTFVGENWTGGRKWCTANPVNLFTFAF